MRLRLSPFWARLAVIAAVALAVRVLFALLVAPDVRTLPPTDAGAYHLLAGNLADGRGYIRPYDRLIAHAVRPTAEYPPLFPGLLGAVAFLGGRSVGAQRLAMCVLGTGTVVLIGLLGRRAAGPAVGLVAAGLAAVYPMLFQPDAVLMAETLYAFCVTAVLVLAYRASREPSAARFVALGLAIGAATLARAEAGFLLVLLAVPLALSRRAIAWRVRALTGSAAVLAALAVVLPWTARNWARFHEVVPVSTNVASALEGANCPDTYSGSQTGLWRFSPTCFRGFEQPALRRANEAEVARVHQRRGLRFARRHSGRLPTVMAVRWARTWGLYDVGDQVQFETLEWRKGRWQTLGVQAYWGMLPLAAVGAWLVARGRRAPVWPLLSTGVLVSITTALTYGNQRFRIAAEPAIVVLAAVSIVALAGRLRRPTAAQRPTTTNP